MSDRLTAPSIPTRCECGDGARMATPCHRTERDGPGPSLCCGSEPPALHSRATCRVRCARQLVPFRGGDCRFLLGSLRSRVGRTRDGGVSRKRAGVSVRQRPPLTDVAGDSVRKDPGARRGNGAGGAGAGSVTAKRRLPRRARVLAAGRRAGFREREVSFAVPPAPRIDTISWLGEDHRGSRPCSRSSPRMWQRSRASSS